MFYRPSNEKCSLWFLDMTCAAHDASRLSAQTVQVVLYRPIALRMRNHLEALSDGYGAGQDLALKPWIRRWIRRWIWNSALDSALKCTFSVEFGVGFVIRRWAIKSNAEIWR